MDDIDVLVANSNDIPWIILDLRYRSAEEIFDLSEEALKKAAKIVGLCGSNKGDV